ncbi:hypothetical protein [Streptomyces sp. NPDC059349]|uniref:hypothetical protein n=1 Tax=Streptomyces sp. NPDC059349 TaxID=3346808 RepID=UPI0036A5F235
MSSHENAHLNDIISATFQTWPTGDPQPDLAERVLQKHRKRRNRVALLAALTIGAIGLFAAIIGALGEAKP